MDVGRTFYWLARVYVWSLVAISVTTAGYFFLPTQSLDTEIGGIWIATAGFGTLVLIIAILIYLFE